jgi:hypothetical protein
MEEKPKEKIDTKKYILGSALFIVGIACLFFTQTKEISLLLVGLGIGIII